MSFFGGSSAISSPPQRGGSAQAPAQAALVAPSLRGVHSPFAGSGGDTFDTTFDTTFASDALVSELLDDSAAHLVGLQDDDDDDDHAAAAAAGLKKKKKKKLGPKARKAARAKAGRAGLAFLQDALSRDAQLWYTLGEIRTGAQLPKTKSNLVYLKKAMAIYRKKNKVARRKYEGQYRYQYSMAGPGARLAAAATAAPEFDTDAGARAWLEEYLATRFVGHFEAKADRLHITKTNAQGLYAIFSQLDAAPISGCWRGNEGTSAFKDVFAHVERSRVDIHPGVDVSAAAPSVVAGLAINDLAPSSPATNAVARHHPLRCRLFHGSDFHACARPSHLASGTFTVKYAALDEFVLHACERSGEARRIRDAFLKQVDAVAKGALVGRPSQPREEEEEEEEKDETQEHPPQGGGVRVDC